jgi:hypothetical protein
MKRCVKHKGITACHECDAFPCDVLTAFDLDEHPHHTGIIDSLRELAASGEEKWLEQQHQRWSCAGCGTDFHWYQDNCKTCGADVAGFTAPSETPGQP